MARAAGEAEVTASASRPRRSARLKDSAPTVRGPANPSEGRPRGSKDPGTKSGLDSRERGEAGDVDDADGHDGNDEEDEDVLDVDLSQQGAPTSEVPLFHFRIPLTTPCARFDGPPRRSGGGDAGEGRPGSMLLLEPHAVLHETFSRWFPELVGKQPSAIDAQREEEEAQDQRDAQWQADYKASLERGTAVGSFGGSPATAADAGPDVGPRRSVSKKRPRPSNAASARGSISLPCELVPVDMVTHDAATLEGTAWPPQAAERHAALRIIATAPDVPGVTRGKKRARRSPGLRGVAVSAAAVEEEQHQGGGGGGGERLVIGHVMPEMVYHHTSPLRWLDPRAVKRGILSFSDCRIELEAPLIETRDVVGPGARHPYGRSVRSSGRPPDLGAEGSWFDPVTKTVWPRDVRRLTPAHELRGDLVFTLNLAPWNLTYGRSTAHDGFVDARRAARYGGVAALKPLLLSAAMHRDGLIDLDRDEADYWTDGGPSSLHHYRLSSRPRILDIFQAVVAANPGLLRGQRLRLGSLRLRHAETEAEALDDADQGGSGVERLPTEHSSWSLLRSVRPCGDAPLLDVMPDAIVTPLLPYQRRAVAWMLGRERATAQKEKHQQQLLGPQWLPFKARRDEDPKPSASSPPSPPRGGARFYLDLTTGVVTLRRFAAPHMQAGGCLCDAMGLGKSLELLTLIAANPHEAEAGGHIRSRSAAQALRLPEEERPPYSSATLIVTPQSLLEQWQEEVGKHWRGGSRARLHVYRRTDAAWFEGKSLAEVRQRAAEMFLERDIVLVAYETLRKHQIAQRRGGGGATLNPFLQVHWHRIALDESQLVTRSLDSAVSDAINNLWRSSSWVVSGTPMRLDGAASGRGAAVHGRSGGRGAAAATAATTAAHSPIADVFGMLVFLDHDPLASRHAWTQLVAAPFNAGNREGVRRLRGLLRRIAWRHEASDVADQTRVPPHTRVTVEVKQTGLERIISVREHAEQREKLLPRLAGGQAVPWDGVQQLRRLLSHPQLARDLGYGFGQARCTFSQLFDRLLERTQRKLDALRWQLVVSVVTIYAGHVAYGEERDRRKWKGGSPVLKKAELAHVLRQARAMCAEYRALEGEGDDADADGATRGAMTAAREEVETEVPGAQALAAAARGATGSSHTLMTWREAFYWLCVALGDEAEEPERFDPLRLERLFFVRETVSADKVDLKDPRYHRIDVDAGEDEIDLEEFGLSLRREAEVDGNNVEQAKGRQQPRGPTDSRDSSAPVVVKQRLRDTKARRGARVWFLVPRMKLERLTELMRAQSESVAKLEKEMVYLRNRAQEETSAASGSEHKDDSSRDGTAQNTSSKSVGSTEGTAPPPPPRASACCICLEEPLVRGVLRGCLHEACFECLLTITRGKKLGTCPVCRQPFLLEDITEILPETSAQDESRGGPMDDHLATRVGEGYGAKMRALLDDMRQRLEADADAKFVVFSLFRTMLSFVAEALREAGVGVAVLAGSEETRHDALSSFRQRRDIKALLMPMSMHEGAAGLTLTTANVCYILEPVLEPSLERQAVGRISRIGQTRATVSVHLVVTDTLEARVVRLAEQRAARQAQERQQRLQTSGEPNGGLADLALRNLSEGGEDSGSGQPGRDEVAPQPHGQDSSSAPGSPPAPQGQGNREVDDADAMPVRGRRRGGGGGGAASMAARRGDASERLSSDDVAFLLDVEEEVARRREEYARRSRAWESYVAATTNAGNGNREAPSGE